MQQRSEAGSAASSAVQPVQVKRFICLVWHQSFIIILRCTLCSAAVSLKQAEARKLGPARSGLVCSGRDWQLGVTTTTTTCNLQCAVCSLESAVWSWPARWHNVDAAGQCLARNFFIITSIFRFVVLLGDGAGEGDCRLSKCADHYCCCCCCCAWFMLCLLPLTHTHLYKHTASQTMRLSMFCLNATAALFLLLLLLSFVLLLLFFSLLLLLLFSFLLFLLLHVI